MKRVLIGGIGNVLLADDAVGPYVARLLDATYEFDEGVEVADLGTPALDLIDQISGRDAVILIDSVDSGAAPGTVLLYRREDIVKHMPSVRMDPHSPALVETLLSAELFAESPKEFLLVGITGDSYEAECGLTPGVHWSIRLAILEVLGELDRLGVKYKKRAHPRDVDIWWEKHDESLAHA
jgi:hydrogenase maturation protease